MRVDRNSCKNFRPSFRWVDGTLWKRRRQTMTSGSPPTHTYMYTHTHFSTHSLRSCGDWGVDTSGLMMSSPKQLFCGLPLGPLWPLRSHLQFINITHAHGSQERPQPRWPTMGIRGAKGSKPNTSLHSCCMLSARSGEIHCGNVSRFVTLAAETSWVTEFETFEYDDSLII